MREELIQEGLRLAAVVIFKAVVATTVAHYTKKFLVECDRKRAAKKNAAAAVN